MKRTAIVLILVLWAATARAVSPTATPAPTNTATPVPTATALSAICSYAWNFARDQLDAQKTSEKVVGPIALGATPVPLIPTTTADRRVYVTSAIYTATGAAIASLDANGTNIDRADLTATVPQAQHFSHDQPTCTALAASLTGSATGSGTAYVTLHYATGP